MKREREDKIKVVVGIDIGSVTAKTVILDRTKKILAYSIVEEGIVNEESAMLSLENALRKAGLTEKVVETLITTGYGRDLVKFKNKSFSEISCHAKGAYFFDPETKTIIDIGGQDSKVIALDSQGKVKAFQMNDKCAAGTGRFLEVMSRALKLSLSSMGEIAANSQHPCHVSSMCTVFAESEIISLSAQGFSKSDIIAGLYESIARRTLSLMSSLPVQPKVMMTGGVAKNRQLVKVLERITNTEIIIPHEPQIVGALGAALIALQGMGGEA